MSNPHREAPFASAMSRRTFLRALGLASGSMVAAGYRPALAGTPPSAFDYEAIIIGTGFGATVTATQLALRNPHRKQKILMLERGVWWFTPERPFPPFIQSHIDTEPIQYWPRPDHGRGLLDFLAVVQTEGQRSLSQVLLDEFQELRELLRPRSRPHPLYRYHQFDELDIVTASGVGGGSLIYSNVTIEPYFDQGTQSYPAMEHWPVQLTKHDYEGAEGALAWMRTYRGAPNEVFTKFPIAAALKDDIKHTPAETLKQQSPEKLSVMLGKCRWLKEVAEALGKDPQWMDKIVEAWAPLQLQVIEYPDPTTRNPDLQTYCERQGRCFLGCLPGARHTLNKTLVSTDPQKNLLNPLNGQLPPVELRSLAEVDHLEALPGGGYRVVYNDLRSGREQHVTAPVVVLAAGCLGSVKLLLRSQAHGLPCSAMLGRRFSTNGDYAGFIDYRPTDERLHLNTAPFPIFTTKGPINASHVMFRQGKLLINFEDATLPPMFAPVVRDALDLLANAVGREPLLRRASGLWRAALRNTVDPDPTKPQSFWTEHEMLQNTFFFNLMGQDDARGVFSLDGDGNLTLRFEGGPLAQDPVYRAMEDVIQAMVAKMGGQYIRLPFWSREGLLTNAPNPERKFVTVHPLGGCVMGRDASDGVVDVRGAVFNPQAGGTAVHQGLYVADASIVPGPVAVNPTLTIVALAQKIASGIP